MTERRAICVQGLIPLALLILAVAAAVFTGRLQWILDYAPFLMVLIVPIVLLLAERLVHRLAERGQGAGFLREIHRHVATRRFLVCQPICQ